MFSPFRHISIGTMFKVGFCLLLFQLLFFIPINIFGMRCCLAYLADFDINEQSPLGLILFLFSVTFFFKCSLIKYRSPHHNDDSSGAAMTPKVISLIFPNTCFSCMLLLLALVLLFFIQFSIE